MRPLANRRRFCCQWAAIALAVGAGCDRRPPELKVTAAAVRPAKVAVAVPTAVVGAQARDTAVSVGPAVPINLAGAATSGDLGLPAEGPTAGQFGATLGQTSQSVGTAQNGHLQGGVPLDTNSSLRILPQTRRNGIHFGTGELVHLLQRSAEAVARDHPGSVLLVGNLSRQDGGDIGPSVSHNSGRDVDVLFYAVDRLGRGRQPPNFCHYDSDGIADGPATDAGQYEFDAERNWALVRNWLTDPAVVVQWIFVAAHLRNPMLDFALRHHEPESLRLRAARVLVQPRDSSPHADHFHLRIACSAGDKPACVDGGVATTAARDAQVDALLQMYHQGSPAEQRYARELLNLGPDANLTQLPPIEGID